MCRVNVLMNVCALGPSPWHNSVSFCLRFVLLILFIQSLEALERNKRWLDYDQHRDAYVSAIMGRMSWQEKQLNEANLSCSKKHNEDHSDGEPEGQWAVGTQHWGNKGQQTVTTSFLRYLDYTGVACCMAGYLALHCIFKTVV